MEIVVIVLIGVGFGLLVWAITTVFFASDPISRESFADKLWRGQKLKIDESDTDNTIDAALKMLEEEQLGTPSNDDNGITELIRQQEQTNKHLQKLISDFLWFRIGIIILLLISILNQCANSGAFN